MSVKLAKLVKKLIDTPATKQYLYHCTPPHCGNEYIVSSARNFRKDTKQRRELHRLIDGALLKHSVFGNAEVMEHAARLGGESETFLFAATETGHVVSHMDLDGSLRDVFCPEEAMKAAGYIVYDPENPKN